MNRQEVINRLKSIPKEQRDTILAQLPADEVESLKYIWELWARPNQLLPPRSDTNYDTVLVNAGRGYGKALSNATEIYTFNRGWIKLGAINVGDMVADVEGNPTRVLNVYHPHTERAFRVRFINRCQTATVIADADHIWPFIHPSIYKADEYDPETWWKQPYYKTTTTLDIFDVLKNKFRLPRAAPVNHPYKPTPMDPYLYGYILAKKINIRTNPFPDWHPYHADYNRDELLFMLDKTGFLDGHIDRDLYLHNSVEVRWGILHGFFDAKSWNSFKGTLAASYNFEDHKIIRFIFDIMQTLQMSAIIRKSRIADRKNLYYIQANQCDAHKLFRYSKTKILSYRPRLQKSFSLDSIREVPVPWVGMTCIEVESPYRIFLVTRAFIPTHNTRMGSEILRDHVCGKTPLSQGKCSSLGVVGETEADVRETIVLGESGILATHPPEFRPKYFKNEKALEWPNGARCLLRYDTEPDGLRGPNFQFVWVDELAKFRNGTQTWEQVELSSRKAMSNGESPLKLITTTPRKGHALLKSLMNRQGVLVIKGTTSENELNLHPSFLANLKDRYFGTELWKQEVEGSLLEDDVGTLWNYGMFQSANPESKKVLKIVVAVDPSGTSLGDDCGIIVCGRDIENDIYYVLEDATLKAGPSEWASKAIAMYYKWSASYIVTETNYGGEMSKELISGMDKDIPVKGVFARTGKLVRAEPVAMIYEQNKVFHSTINNMTKLEDQLVSYNGTGKSPNRLDALVYAILDLKGKRQINPRQLSTMKNIKLAGFYS